MPCEETDVHPKDPSSIVISRKLELHGGFKLKNVVRSSRYLLGSLVCFIVVGFYFQVLGLASFFVGLFGVILFERCIFILSGLQTR